MTTPRGLIYDPDQPGVYHCYSRCAQHAYLCGYDPITGQNFDHRKQWLETRTQLLAGLFSVKLLDFGLLDNHMHHVLENCPDIRDSWSDEDVAYRWVGLQSLQYPEIQDVIVSPRQVRQALRHPKLPQYRQRLGDISWFMKELKEKVARWANLESGTSGCFWAGRFRATHLLDEAAVFTCSLYVDLNRIRAGLEDLPEQSRFTSVFLRIQALQQEAAAAPPTTPSAVLPLDHETTALLDPATDLADDDQDPPAAPPPSAPPPPEPSQPETSQPEPSQPEPSPSETPEPVPPTAPRHQAQRRRRQKRLLVRHLNQPPRPDAWLAPISENGEAGNHTAPQFRASNRGFLPLSSREYLRVLDLLGRELRRDKPGAIPDEVAPIFNRLGLATDQWLDTIQMFHGWFPLAVGHEDKMREAAHKAGRRWFQGIQRCRDTFT